MAEQRAQRRLAAIMAADVVGYSRLMGEDESGTLYALNLHRAELIHPTVAEYRGRIVKLMGDGALVEFPSVVDAVECAVAVQRGMDERNTDVPDSKRITFRIGINLGDIIIEGDDIYGDGVNVAARLEAEAEPGGICISSSAHQQVVGKIDLNFEDLGERTLKNIAGPVRAYRWSTGNSAPTAATAPDQNPHPPGEQSIIVLPFDNLSNDPEQEFFSDGISEDLITDLSKLSNLFVVSRNTAFTYKGQSIDVVEIGRKLRVAHVLEGSVRRAGNRVRINAQLIETARGGHVWADRYDGSLDDIFMLQDEITEKIIAELQVRLTVQEAAQPRHHVTDNAKAYELFLRGRAELLRLNPEGTLSAVNTFREVIDADPEFASAYVSLSLALQHGWTFAFPGFEDVFNSMLEYAQRAVELDDGMALAHARLGWALIFQRRYEEAVSSIERAAEIGHHDAETHMWITEALNYAGNPERGAQMGERAFELEDDPDGVYYLVRGHSHYLLREYDTAIELFNGAIARIPGFPLPYLLLGTVYFEMGRMDEAAERFDKLHEALPPHVLDVVVSRLPYRKEESRRRILEALEHFGKVG